jgi:hypothetical protein
MDSTHYSAGNQPFQPDHPLQLLPIPAIDLESDGLSASGKLHGALLPPTQEETA